LAYNNWSKNSTRTYDEKIIVLSSRISSHIGESVGRFLIRTELSRIDHQCTDHIDDNDYDLLISNLKENLSTLLGEESTQWLLEGLGTHGYGK
jgi:hypothetical protein